MSSDAQPYLTYQLELIQSSAIKAANPVYVEAVDLRVKELRVLRILHESPGLTATDLQKRLVLDKTLLSKNLAYLERRGLIRRVPDPRDSRFQCLSLSKEGQRVWKVCEKRGRDLERQMFRHLSPTEWQQLHGLLEKAYASFLRWSTGSQPGKGKRA